jgi:hypothetical protein
MGFGGFIRSVRNFILYSLLFLVFMMFAPGIPPHNTPWKMLTVDKLPYVGRLAENKALEKAEILTREVDHCTIGEFSVCLPMYHN